ncbi:uncharacterized protein LOC129918961 [Episyrphus balteatus]|uniref:uncharacterized protein LOC129918961 n=1 Tax=Episyrphus balteatus TaxID=286459 RepID=UPI002485C3A8|nr:uncharacterized protein LOC129918961 [Episyrphus balteatus]
MGFCKYFPSVVIVLMTVIQLSEGKNDTKLDAHNDTILSRKERFIAFPMGSTFSVAVCMTVGTIGNPNVNYLSLGMNWGIAYELPNITWVLEQAHGFPKKPAPAPEPVIKRRYRRDLYQKLELLMDGLKIVETYKSVDLLNFNYGTQLPTEESYLMKKNEIIPHRRSKRYIAFPEGSSFTCAVCFTVGVVGSPRINYLSYGLNWGIAYDLPNETWIIDHLHGFSNTRQPSLAVLKRRNRRSLYHSIENLIDRMGYNGRDCVLRALCESRQFFQSKKLGMIPELIRTIFSLPKTRLLTREIEEHSDIKHYNDAYFRDEDEDCELRYPCSFSLLELAMGRYSEPSEHFYGDY